MKKILAGCFVAWSCTSAAVGFVVNEGAAITIKNESGAYIHGAFQSQIMAGIAPDSINSAINPEQAFTYDETDSFFNSGAVQIKPGDTINQVGIFDTAAQSFVICDNDVVFEGQTGFVYDGAECNLLNEGTRLELLFELPEAATAISTSHATGSLGGGGSHSSAYRMPLDGSGRYEDLSSQTGAMSTAYDVNNHGDIVVTECTDEVQYRACLPSLWSVDGSLIRFEDLHALIEPTITEGHYITYRPFAITDNQTVYGSVRFMSMPSAPVPKNEEVAWEWSPVTGARILENLDDVSLDTRGSNARGGDGNHYIVGQSLSIRFGLPMMLPVYWEKGADKPIHMVDITGGWLMSRGISNQNADVLANIDGKNAIVSLKHKTVKELDNPLLHVPFPYDINENGEVIGFSEESDHAIVFWDQNQKGHVVDVTAFEGRTPSGTISLNNDGVISVGTFPDYPSLTNGHYGLYQIVR